MNILDAPSDLFYSERLEADAYDRHIWDRLKGQEPGILRLSKCACSYVKCEACAVALMRELGTGKICPICATSIANMRFDGMVYTCGCGCLFRCCTGTIRGIYVPIVTLEMMEKPEDII